MDNSSIYDNYMMTTCFSRLKSIRNSWSEEKENKYGLATIIDIGGSDYRSFDFIMDRSESIILEMIPYLVMELIKAYGIKTHWYQIMRNDAHIYSVSEDEKWPDYVEQSNRQAVFAFSCEDDVHKGILYIFKEYGIGNRLPKSLIDTIISENKLQHYCYISIVEEDAYKEVLNHNENLNDPSRGTGLFSLQQFFESFFDREEYATFKRYANELTKKVKDYYGFKIVRTLKPNTLHNYRKTVRDDLYGFKVNSIETNGRLSERQRELIEGNYFKNNNCELLTGTSDFAQSYLTAEWLFSSLTDAGNMDLTAIAMGYFKSIEQFLFGFIKLHTIEKDGVTRKIHVGKEGYVNLTDSLIQDGKRTKDINLGSLTGFFGFYNENRNQYIRRNRDLLIPDIDEDTYEFIIDVLNGIVGLRNGFFHKHNLVDWTKVIEARNNVRLVFYLILGAYKISDQDKKELGMLEWHAHDDYYRLCEYINAVKNMTGDRLMIPIFYFDNKDEYNFWYPFEDSFIEYDAYGEPKYSGIYFKRPDKYDNRILKITKDNLPKEIWEGVLRISISVPIDIKPSGPLKKIYTEGKFLA